MIAMIASANVGPPLQRRGNPRPPSSKEGRDGPFGLDFNWTSTGLDWTGHYRNSEIITDLVWERQRYKYVSVVFHTWVLAEMFMPMEHPIPTQNYGTLCIPGVG